MLCKAALVLAIFLLIYFSLVPSDSIEVSASDKILHFIAYAIIASVAAAAFPRAGLLSVFLGASALGATLEVAQALFGTGRSASLADQLANMGGAALVILGWVILAMLMNARRQNS